MNKESLGNKVFKQIKEKNIKIKPSWEFLLKRSVYWFGFVFSILFGAIAISLIFFMINVHDWDIYVNLGHDFWEFLFMSMPYFWLLILAAFSFVAYYNYKHTDTGYKYNYYLVVLGSVLISVVLGSVLFRVGFSEWLDKKAYDLPFYKGMNDFHEEMWQNPDKGLILGKVIEIEEGYVVVEDIDLLRRELYFDLESKRGFDLLREGDLFKFILMPPEDGEMVIFEVRPWRKKVPFDKIKRPKPLK